MFRTMRGLLLVALALGLAGVLGGPGQSRTQADNEPDLKEQLAKAREELVKTKEVLSLERKKNQQLETLNRDLRSQLDQKDAAVQKKIQVLQVELAKAEKERDALLHKVQHLSQHNVELKKALDEARAKLNPQPNPPLN